MLVTRLETKVSSILLLSLVSRGLVGEYYIVVVR